MLRIKFIHIAIFYGNLVGLRIHQKSIVHSYIFDILFLFKVFRCVRHFQNILLFGFYFLIEFELIFVF